ncbi:MAG: TATA-box-binding protein [Thermoproteota archaeon]|jgi:transcription initiation factor TFIID TATA-box-binding protein|nr:TATA-box-binding protein [Thermoproteota archaeon]
MVALKGKYRYEIQNVVASISFGHSINLQQVATAMEDMVEYRPEQFPGLVFRLNKPKTATLIFSSGKMVCTGARSEKEVYKAVDTIISKLKARGIHLAPNPRIQIQNIVASAQLNAEVNLEKAAMLFENTMYEPEQFPGLIFRLQNPRVVMLIFSSGNMVCTGAKKEEDVKNAVETVYKLLKEQGVLFERA